MAVAVQAPRHAAASLPRYGDFVQVLYSQGVLTDAWSDGEPRFRLEGVVLSPAQARALRRAAERLGALYQELVSLVWAQPRWLDTFFHLTPYQKLMWFAAQGEWHGIARADLFFCRDGRLRCAEVNSDTPSGQPEAVLLNRLLRPYHGAVRDPNRGLPQAFWRMLVAAHGGRAPRRVGIVYPTEFTEDLGMITLYRRWLAARGCHVVLGSPYNLHPCGEGVGLFGEPVELVLRHYKTDWWGERQAVWRHAPPYPDPEPLVAPLRLLLEAAYAGKVTVVNPFGAVLTQNKRALAFLWEEQQRFSPRARRWIRRYLPETYRLEQVPREVLRRQRHRWVLKSAYGCEGEETVCGPFVSEAEWQEAVASARPEAWVCQRFFEVQPEPDGTLPNFGVFLVGGRSAGFFTRLARGTTDETALTAPTFVARR